MNQRSILRWCIALVLAVASSSVFFGQAQAQYPPVTGSVVMGAGDTTPDLGEEVAITASVLDENGDPAAGVECTFIVIEQPGDDARVAAGPFTTDAFGDVTTTLMTGSTSGTVAVEARCGDLAAQVSVVAGPGQPPAGAAQPPASLPDTGAGRESSGGGWAFWAFVALGTAAGLGGLAVAWRRGRA